MTIDYRGFGYSTGSPTEHGLIADGIALVEWAQSVAGIPPKRIILFGQSLGTAVATAVAEHYVLQSQIEFAGIVLVAAFSDIPTLMTTYAIGGIIPILSPLRPYPALRKFFANHIQEIWDSAARLNNLAQRSQGLNLRLIHARNDFDIPWSHSTALFYAAANGTSEGGMTKKQIDDAKTTEELGQGAWAWHWKAGNAHVEGIKTIRLDIVQHGGESKTSYLARKELRAKLGIRAQPTSNVCSSLESSTAHVQFIGAPTSRAFVKIIYELVSEVSQAAFATTSFAKLKPRFNYLRYHCLNPPVLVLASQSIPLQEHRSRLLPVMRISSM